MGRYQAIQPARAVAAVIVSAALVVGFSWPVVAAAESITCAPVTVSTVMNTAVSGQVACSSATGSAMTYAARPYQADSDGPANGKVVVDPATGGYCLASLPEGSLNMVLVLATKLGSQLAGGATATLTTVSIAPPSAAATATV